MMPQPVLSLVSVALFVIGIAGNGFEMRKIRLTTEGQPNPRNVFADKRNFKWYAFIGIALVLWQSTEPIRDLYRSTLNIS